ncbi:hypothetical protein LTR56_005039 [Elasticomyces elasticus]|nr:hypothetical protein LTR56_005039 [Elasticomyces elasticus]KAK3655861.1 hypothetical protein LTR22_010019 [Elasticomyces elasticus]KAK4912588.1 hypothetical protein LTR49_018950 [Elasticomyces elasticus]KAK5752064.1 hypothetical protein LTS12_017827 [Elasticomyces elasticus]
MPNSNTMPHATTDDMSTSLTNGDKPSSKFLSHVTSYPVVNDSISTFKSNPYAKQALEIADGAYQKFGKPVEPYLETPYSYAKPYIAAADEIADNGLQKVDGRFPIVKEDTEKVVETGKSYVFWPYNYLYGTYSDEYQKTSSHSNNSNGLFILVKAVISTELKIASDVFQLIADMLGPKYEESKKKGSHYIRASQEQAEHYKDVAQNKLGEYQQIGQDKYDECSTAGRQKAEELKGQAENVNGQAQQKGEELKGQAKETKEQAKGQAKETKEEAKAKTGSK